MKDSKFEDEELSEEKIPREHSFALVNQANIQCSTEIESGAISTVRRQYGRWYRDPKPSYYYDALGFSGGRFHFNWKILAVEVGIAFFFKRSVYDVQCMYRAITEVPRFLGFTSSVSGALTCSVLNMLRDRLGQLQASLFRLETDTRRCEKITDNVGNAVKTLEGKSNPNQQHTNEILAETNSESKQAAMDLQRNHQQLVPEVDVLKKNSSEATVAVQKLNEKNKVVIEKYKVALDEQAFKIKIVKIEDKVARLQGKLKLLDLMEISQEQQESVTELCKRFSELKSKINKAIVKMGDVQGKLTKNYKKLVALKSKQGNDDIEKSEEELKEIESDIQKAKKNIEILGNNLEKGWLSGCEKLCKEFEELFVELKKSLNSSRLPKLEFGRDSVESASSTVQNMSPR